MLTLSMHFQTLKHFRLTDMHAAWNKDVCISWAQQRVKWWQVANEFGDLCSSCHKSNTKIGLTSASVIPESAYKTCKIIYMSPQHDYMGKLLGPREYIKCVFLPLTEVMGPIMNLISEIHNFCERREYAFNVLPEYIIITHEV